MKILNLYAGIGGNRMLWGKEHKVTAIENNPEIAKMYQDFFPDDKVIVTDAHKYLLEHYKEFDFIWSSPPCPTHSRMRLLKNNIEEQEKKYPNMKLYEEIIFLKHFFKGKWVVENVISYYEPLIRPYRRDAHYFWSNFNIIENNVKTRRIRKQLEPNDYFGIKDKVIKVKDDPHQNFKRMIMNNCINPKLGLLILKCAFKTKQQTLKTGGQTKNPPKK